MGTSRQLAVGPVAMVSLLLEAGLRGLVLRNHAPEQESLFLSGCGIVDAFYSFSCGELSEYFGLEIKLTASIWPKSTSYPSMYM